jgi:hypothetical protein
MEGKRAWQLRTFGKLALVVGLALGCGSDERLSLGEYCSRIGAAVCDRGIACGLATAAERPMCLTEFQAGCCMDDGACGERAMTDAEEMEAEMLITACTGALPTYDCAMLGAGNIPVECGGTAAASALTYATPARQNVTLPQARTPITRAALDSSLGKLARARLLNRAR